MIIRASMHIVCVMNMLVMGMLYGADVVSSKPDAQRIAAENKEIEKWFLEHAKQIKASMIEKAPDVKIEMVNPYDKNDYPDGGTYREIDAYGITKESERGDDILKAIATFYRTHHRVTRVNDTVKGHLFIWPFKHATFGTMSLFYVIATDDEFEKLKKTR